MLIDLAINKKLKENCKKFVKPLALNTNLWYFIDRE
jgi:hypothetical protein